VSGEFQIYRWPPPIPRPRKRTRLDDLVSLAKSMEPGDAVLLTMSEAQIMRYILVAQGFDCATDGYRSPDKPRILVFKLPPVPAPGS